MFIYPLDRRKAHDPEYFEKGGVERRRGPWDRRSNRDRRRFWRDRRVLNDPNYAGPERRSGADRRSGKERRRSQVQESLEERPNSETVSARPEKKYLKPRAEIIPSRRKEKRTMELDGRSVKVKIKPALYPSIKIYFQENQDNALESQVMFPKEFWLDLANTCKEVTSNMGPFSSQKIATGLSLMSQAIMGEISAEEKRMRNKEAYEAFVDFVTEVNSRADLDKVRKGQLIHDEAHRLKLQL